MKYRVTGLFLGLTICALASADYGAYVRTGLYDPSGGWNFTYDIHSDPDTATAHLQTNPNLFTSSAGWAMAGNKQLHLSGSAFSQANPGTIASHSFTQAWMSDVWHPSSNEFDGQNGFIKAKITFEGHLHASILGNASSAATFAIRWLPNGIGSTDWILNYRVDANTGVDGDQTVNDWAYILIPCVYGQSLNYELRIGGSAGADSSLGGMAGANYDFSDTLTWQGISEFEDANGNAISGVSMTSDSGTDWVTPVPESKWTGLLTLGLAVPFLRRRPRKS